jgi:DNA-binding LacI/PurR family transcriptional regulator
MSRPKKATESDHPKRVTLRDVAEVAGVHVMTVSDALNGTGRVAAATRQRIAEIARELHYVPNATARALATGRTYRIALLAGAYDQPYYANMLHFLKTMLEDDGYQLLLLRTPFEVHEMIYTTANTEVDGVIAIDMFSFGEEFGKNASIPCVSVGAYERKAVDCVLIDLTDAVEQALQIMFGARRKRVAYLVTHELMAKPDQSRAKAYLESAAKWGQKPEIINVETNYNLRVHERFTVYVKEHGCPDALLCQNDETAMSAYRVVRDQGLRVPEDVLIMGCDGHLHMDFFDPPLSTVVQPVRETCEAAWRFLRQRIADPSLPHQQATLYGKLKVTDSLRA